MPTNFKAHEHKPNLLVVGYGDELKVEIINSISKSCGIKPKLWVAKDRFSSNVKHHFPNAVFYSTEQSERKLKPYEFVGENWPGMDPQLLALYKEHEATLWPLFLRRKLPKSSLSSLDGKREYYRQLTFYSKIIDSCEIDIAIFSHMPHHFYTYVFYLFCKLTKVPTVVGLRSKLFQNSEIFVSSFEEGAKVIEEKKDEILERSGNEPIVIKPENEAIIKLLKADYDKAMPEYTKARFALSSNGKQLVSRENIFQQLLKPLFTPTFLRSPAAMFTQYHMIMSRYILMRYYEKHASGLSKSKPYIVVLLHRQPEASSSPSGGEFITQHLIVEMLSKAIPDDWVIYVKEHPSQLYWQHFNSIFRSKNYYDELLRIEKVRFLTVKEQIFSSIEDAKFVATITGTTGWEAVVRGIPVLIFGSAWYRYCEGVYHISNMIECRAAVEKIIDGKKINSKGVQAFVKAWECTGVPKVKNSDLNLCAEKKQKLVELKSESIKKSIESAITEVKRK